MKLVYSQPKQAVVIFNRLLTDYQDSPVIYRTAGCIYRARALAVMGNTQAAVDQLDLLINSLERAFPPGHPKDDPPMRQMLEGQKGWARSERQEIAGGAGT
jgi:hypothetical protein